MTFFDGCPHTVMSLSFNQRFSGLQGTEFYNETNGSVLGIGPEVISMMHKLMPRLQVIYRFPPLTDATIQDSFLSMIRDKVS